MALIRADLRAQAPTSLATDRYLHGVVARNLVICRQHRRASQEAFAVVLGVHRTYAGGLERGEHNLTLARVERLARCLDVHVLTLLLPSDYRTRAERLGGEPGLRAEGTT
jgi:transcriptional regulator with XRE-family HTH domain